MVLSGSTNSRLEALRALRDGLAAQIDDCESKRDYATLAKQFMDALEQIEAVEKAQPAQKGTALDEFTRRRAEREATSSPAPAKRRQRG